MTKKRKRDVDPECEARVAASAAIETPATPDMAKEMPACLACGSAVIPVEDATRAICPECGAVMAIAATDQSELLRNRDRRFMRAYGLPNHEERSAARAMAHEAMSGYFRITRGKPASLNGFGKSLLEVDCGLGFRLRAFQDYGWTVFATERSATASEYARRQSLDVRNGDVCDCRYGNTTFDLVLFCSVFGELAEPKKVVDAVGRLLGAGGLVCVLREPLTGAGMESREARLTLHTPDSIGRLFRTAGFASVGETIDEDLEGTYGTFWFRLDRGTP